MDRHTASGGAGRGTQILDHPFGEFDHRIEDNHFADRYLRSRDPYAPAPDEATAVVRLRMEERLKSHREALRGRFATLVIPELNLSEASLQDIAEFLQQTIRDYGKAEPGQASFEVVLRLSRAEASRRVSLRASNISMRSIFQSVFDGYEIVYEENRVIVYGRRNNDLSPDVPQVRY